MQTCGNITDDVTLTFGKTMRQKSLNWCGRSDFQLMPTTVYCDMPAGLLMYTSLARLALTHIENDLDDLHGRVCHCGGCHSAVGQALQGKARRKGRVHLYSCSIPAYSYNV